MEKTTKNLPEKPAKKTTANKKTKRKISISKIYYPRHSLEKSLRIPKAILEQNAGKDCTDKESASLLGMKYNNGPYAVELSSSLKFGLLDRPKKGMVSITELARKILRPKESEDELSGLRKSVLMAPTISSVYGHYRGENLPDEKFLDNTLTDTFKIPKEKISDFKSVLMETLKFSKLIDEKDGKNRILDVTDMISATTQTAESGKGRIAPNIVTGDTCFVMMPFASPLGEYYKKYTSQLF